jgi:hypothetical protein
MESWYLALAPPTHGEQLILCMRKQDHHPIQSDCHKVTELRGRRHPDSELAGHQVATGALSLQPHGLREVTHGYIRGSAGLVGKAAAVAQRRLAPFVCPG